MKKIIGCLILFSSFTVLANDTLPSCKAELKDENNTLVSKVEWQEDLFMGHLEGATLPMLITTSVGNDKVMSLWVREKKQKNEAGMFSFVDLSSGKEQFLKFYMSDGYAVAVTCQWP